MPKPFDESKHTRDAGKFAPKGQGRPGKGKDAPKGKPVSKDQPDVPDIVGGFKKAAEERERNERSKERGKQRKPGPSDPASRMDPRVTEALGRSATPTRDTEAQAHISANAHAGHGSATNALSAIESGNLQTANVHGKSMQLAIKQLKTKGASDEELAPIRGHLTKLAHGLKTNDPIMAHEAAAGLKHEFFKIRHKTQGALGGGGPLPNQATAAPGVMSGETVNVHTGEKSEKDIQKKGGLVEEVGGQSAAELKKQKSTQGEGSGDPDTDPAIIAKQMGIPIDQARQMVDVSKPPTRRKLGPRDLGIKETEEAARVIEEQERTKKRR